MALQIIDPGFLTLTQDLGRFGQHHLGLTTGGPMDPFAFRFANRLVDNQANSVALEITMGGFKAVATQDMCVAVTGAKVDVSVDGKRQPQWRTLYIKNGQKIELAYAVKGCRIYLSVAGGFDIKKQFDSASAVVREGIGGINGGKLESGAELKLKKRNSLNQAWYLPESYIPNYGNHAVLRVIPGYQEKHFSRHQQRRFFYHDFRISDLADRMGYRLQGPKIECDINGILSEGICLGAIQIPADGQPIVLMNDRQTIGGYPKIGSVLSLDLAKLSQLTPGATVNFEPISIDHAHNLLHLADHKFKQIELKPCLLEANHERGFDV
ncbi:biotin-dependent carboxyltransferase [Bermanella marisrubri]|uniref:Carboxyltransferase domain-containing protein n=1 Tax=Bermanella marisrubri TaxID=207949 RepID=Q1N2K2_9GAMM|nr:biotin-dependent carboxyltransferase family protein [Bermanella marisrubri]EAT12405.1 hypothetical protein RED65_16246 [Oceanobacter sp. RED65] [Bermanella marisrubri]QIZ85486.1 biotin-dependent carboxyltransferase [Bermanella marisrubri]